MTFAHPSCHAMILTALVAFAACSPDRAHPPSSAGATSARADSASEQRDSALTWPDGVVATIFADTLGGARQVAVSSRGDVYVNTWRSPYDSGRRVPAGGFLAALRDTNRDGRADRIERFGAAGPGRRGGTGISIRGDTLWAESDSAIVRYRLTAGELAPQGAPDTIVTGLTMVGDHPMHALVVDGRGNLFVNMGSASNACQVTNRAPASPGRDPCPELRERAGIWRFSSSRPGQRFSPAARYATGIRNAVGLAIGPEGALYATQHGRDQLAENWPKLFDWKQSAELPAEELLRVEQGGDYGWPYCYYDPAVKRLVLAPEYGGDGKQVGRCAEKLAPIAAFPAHWAPVGLAFASGAALPEHYRHGAFIAFHGSWNRAPEPQEGYNVVFQPFGESGPSGEYEVFADGFAGARKEPGLAKHRPVGLAFGPDGALFITDDQAGRLWRVTGR